MDEEHLIEGESFLCDEGLFSRFREMNIGERVCECWEVESMEDLFWNEIRNIVDIFFQNVTDLPTEKFRGESGGLGIDRDEATGMCLIPLGAFEGGIGEEEASLVGSDLAGDADLCADLQRLGDEFLIEPDDTDRAGVVSEGRFGNEHVLPESADGFESRDFAANGRPLIHREVADISRDGIIFVASGKMEEEIAHALNPELFQSDEIVGSYGGNGVEWGIWGHMDSV